MRGFEETHLFQIAHNITYRGCADIDAGQSGQGARTYWSALLDVLIHQVLQYVLFTFSEVER